MPEPSLNLISVLTLLGAAQAFLFACALIGIKRGNAVANRLLAALLLVISVILVWNILLNTRYLLQYPHLAQLHVPLQFLIAPLCFLYIKSLLAKSQKLGRKYLLHFIPASICLLYLLPFYFQSSAYKLEFLTAAIQSYPREWYVRTLLVLLQGSLYMIPILSLGLQRRGRAQAEPAAVDKSNLYWVRIWTGIFLAIWIASIVRFVFDYSVQTNLVIPLLFSVFIYTAVYVKLRRSSEVVTEKIEDRIPVKRYEKSTLTQERAERSLSRLREVMLAEKPFTDTELTLPKLAERMGISAHHLSQIINERLNQNFFDFINAHRIEEAKRRLLDPKKKHLSILGIAEEVGFNSKSTFNAAFKKHTGMTPSEWRKSS
ncbi:MAG: AraC family transcriptional regulator, partial [Pyrinomonadaceae bacterium]|nr:AraC family transcriptional regulator [Pyrinomonadaceae bacterium]